MIQVEHLSKRYGKFTAVQDLSFTVQAGEVVGFLGPNGAGKSTTLRIIAGFLGATAGRVSVSGRDIVTHRIQALEQIGYMPETAPLYPEMRVTELLTFRAQLKRVGRKGGRKAISKEIDRVAELAKVSDVAAVPVGELSKGYRQRVALADALLGAPPLLILDEPSAGLDPNQIRQVRDLIRHLGGEHTVLLSSHILPEIEATCSQVVVIDRGRLVATGTIDEVRQEQAPAAVRLILSGTVTPAIAAIEAHEAVKHLTHDEDTHAKLVAELHEGAMKDVGATIAELVACAIESGALVREAAPESPSLESVFSRLTQSESAESEAEA